jgi:hypothetical protein
MTPPIGRALWSLLVAAATGGCYHQYLLVTGSDQLPEKQQKTVYSYAWGLVHATGDVAVCPETSALDQVEVKANFGMTILGILTLGIVVPRRMIWYCSTPRECVDDIGLLRRAGAGGCNATTYMRRAAARPPHAATGPIAARP